MDETFDAIDKENAEELVATNGVYGPQLRRLHFAYHGTPLITSEGIKKIKVVDANELCTRKGTSDDILRTAFRMPPAVNISGWGVQRKTSIVVSGDNIQFVIPRLMGVYSPNKLETIYVVDPDRKLEMDFHRNRNKTPWDKYSLAPWNQFKWHESVLQWRSSEVECVKEAIKDTQDILYWGSSAAVPAVMAAFKSMTNCNTMYNGQMVMTFKKNNFKDVRPITVELFPTDWVPSNPRFPHDEIVYPFIPKK